LISLLQISTDLVCILDSGINRLSSFCNILVSIIRHEMQILPSLSINTGDGPDHSSHTFIVTSERVFVICLLVCYLTKTLLALLFIMNNALVVIDV
jgi:hypothetical protein